MCYEETRYRGINLRKIPHRKKCYFYSLARAAGPHYPLLASLQLITLCSYWGSWDFLSFSHFCWIMKKARKFQKKKKKKKIYFCFWEYCFWEYQSTLSKKPHLTWENLLSLRNLYVSQETSWTCMEKGLVQNWERSTTRLYIVTWLI